MLNDLAFLESKLSRIQISGDFVRNLIELVKRKDVQQSQPQARAQIQSQYHTQAAPQASSQPRPSQPTALLPTQQQTSKPASAPETADSQSPSNTADTASKPSTESKAPTTSASTASLTTSDTTPSAPAERGNASGPGVTTSEDAWPEDATSKGAEAGERSKKASADGSLGTPSTAPSAPQGLSSDIRFQNGTGTAVTSPDPAEGLAMGEDGTAVTSRSTFNNEEKDEEHDKT